MKAFSDALALLMQRFVLVLAAGAGASGPADSKVTFTKDWQRSSTTVCRVSSAR